MKLEELERQADLDAAGVLFDQVAEASFLINDRQCASSTLRRCGAGTRGRDARKSVFPGWTFATLTADGSTAHDW